MGKLFTAMTQTIEAAMHTASRVHRFFGAFGRGSPAGLLAVLLVSGVLAVNAQAQLSFSGLDNDAASYASDDGSTSFVLDRSGARPLLKFTTSEEVLVLAPGQSSFGDTVLNRDDGAPMVTIDTLGSVILQDGAEEIFMSRSGPAEPLRVPKMNPADVKAMAAKTSKAASDALGHGVVIAVDVDSFQGNLEDLGAARHQLVVIERALLMLAQKGADTAAVVDRITLRAGGRISAEFDKKTLKIVMVPQLGYGAGFSSYLLATLMDGDE